MDGPDESWLSISPLRGSILPENSQEITLQITPSDMDTGFYEAFINIENNSIDSLYVLLVTLHVLPGSGVGDEGMDLVRELRIREIYPNPFNSRVRIDFELPMTTTLQAAVYDAQGRMIDLLYDGKLPAGIHSLAWNGGSFPAGIYFCRISSGEKVSLKKWFC